MLKSKQQHTNAVILVGKNGPNQIWSKSVEKHPRCVNGNYPSTILYHLTQQKPPRGFAWRICLLQAIWENFVIFSGRESNEHWCEQMFRKLFTCVRSKHRIHIQRNQFACEIHLMHGIRDILKLMALGHRLDNNPNFDLECVRRPEILRWR